MGNFSTIRTSYKLKNLINEVKKNYGMKTIILYSFYIVGFIIGAIIMARLVSNFDCENIIDKNFYTFLLREESWLFLFWKYLLGYAIIICYSIFLNKSIFLNFINFCILFIAGFCFGYSLILYISIFNAIALICFILIMPIFNFIIMLIYCSIVAVAWALLYEKKKFGRICDCKKLESSRKLYICYSLFLIILLLCYCLCLNIFRLIIVI